MCGMLKKTNKTLMAYVKDSTCKQLTQEYTVVTRQTADCVYS